MAKREIKAKDFMNDIQAGMEDAELMTKYGLTPKGLDSTFRKLLTVGLISRVELEVRKIGQEETVDFSGLDTAMTQQIKACGSEKKRTQYSFSGRVEGVDILDYIQWMLIDRRRTILEVRPINGSLYRLFVDEGKVLHAATRGFEGEEAFYRCVKFEGGEFVHLPWTDPERITIEKAGTLLLFEAARRRDESHSELVTISQSLEGNTRA